MAKDICALCGLNGIFAYGDAASPVDRAELKRTRDRMAARGPDGKGLWVSDDERIGLAHRRLSIIDLSDVALQPMSSADGRYIIVFNGEIYNYKALRRELEAKGRIFYSQSDTEVLLHLFAERGTEMVHALRGMFAFGLWDRTERSLFLARDPYGIKPLYYCDDGRTLRFASQVKALIAGGSVSQALDPGAQVGFLLWGSVPEPITKYDSIRALPAGSFMTANLRGTSQIIRYFSIAEVYKHAEGKPVTHEEIPEFARAALLDSVSHHLVADVPVGVFLSAGIDSGALVGLMRDAGQDDIQTVTVSFNEFTGRSDDEAPLAAMVASHYETRHTNRVVDEAEFIADLPRILDAMDQPSIDGVNTWFVSKAAREAGLKVAISGLGGDELFGGYPAFRDVPRWSSRTAFIGKIPFLGSLIRYCAVLIGLETFGLNPKLAGMLEFGGTYAGAYLLRRGVFMPWELGQLLDIDVVRAGLRRLSPLEPAQSALQPLPASAHGVVATLESSVYMRNQLLRDSDWASMAHSIEVRTPLVDSHLVQKLAPALVAAASPLDKFALALAPRKPLPNEIMHRKKTGFSTPIATWLRPVFESNVRGMPAKLAAPSCPWARRWAHYVADYAP